MYGTDRDTNQIGDSGGANSGTNSGTNRGGAPNLTKAQSAERRINSAGDRKTVGMAADSAEAFKRFVVVRNGRGILADGDDMEQLERNYQAASENADDRPRRGAGGWQEHTWPSFASLARCDHEGETGKVCIVDSADAPDAVSSYYGVGFVD